MSQWGFVGPAYQAANPAQDDQALINWFVESDPNEPTAQQGPDTLIAEAKSALGLLGTPGLESINSQFTGPYRGGWTLPGGVSALMVIGFSVVLAQVVGSSNGRPTFSFTEVGTMNSSGGPVNIRDNGAGHVAVLVDGTTTLGVYFTLSQSYVNYVDPPGYLGATNVAFFDGWFVFNKPNSQIFFTSPNYWDGITAFDPTYFALKDNASDNLVGLIENNREIWMIGEETTEPWYNAGGVNFPLSRIEGAMMQIGCAAAQSIARTGRGLMWLSRSERGSLSVIMTQGYQFSTVSTPAVAYQINQYGSVYDAQGYVYSEEGHEFYVLTFPQADVTWVYDLTTQLWHQRASFDSATGLFHRQRLNGLVFIGGVFIGGDYASGNMYRQSRTLYDDGGNPLVAVRRAPHVWDKKDRNRVINSRLQIEFFPGAGLVTGQGSDPQVMLRWSNDGGQNFGNEHWTGIGKIGETKRRAIWRRLGAARDRVYEVRISDPVNRDIVGASLQGTATGA